MMPPDATSPTTWRNMAAVAPRGAASRSSRASRRISVISRSTASIEARRASNCRRASSSEAGEPAGPLLVHASTDGSAVSVRHVARRSATSVQLSSSLVAAQGASSLGQRLVRPPAALARRARGTAGPG